MDLSTVPKDKRTCWECNPAHQALKQSAELLRCILCWRRFQNGQFLDTVRRKPTKG